MERIDFSEIEGIRTGSREDLKGGTGCTVIIADQSASAGVDVRGGSPATRETDLLRSENQVDRIHAIYLSGGSAFGLEGASGVMKYLEERNIGFDVGLGVVPIVVAAALFDLDLGDKDARPDISMGYLACVESEKNYVRHGNYGAGTGATVGKFFGPERSMKGGLGSYAIQLGDLQVGALVAVNALGDVVDRSRDMVLAGLLDSDRRFPSSTFKEMIQHHDRLKDVFTGNTTIGCIVTNASFEKPQMNKIASIAHNGYARAIVPVHTSFDGDTIFSMATNKVEADFNLVGSLAAYVMEKAILEAVIHSEEAYGYKSYKSIK